MVSTGIQNKPTFIIFHIMYKLGLYSFMEFVNKIANSLIISDSYKDLSDKDMGIDFIGTNAVIFNLRNNIKS